MDESTLINAIKTLRDQSSNITSFDSDISSTWQSLIDQLENYESIDKELIVSLKQHLGDDLVNKKSYKEVIDAIQHGSTVVYFKSAQLFKIYKHDELQTLLSGHLRTIYKNISNSYEIVPNEANQKIVIMGEQSLESDINTIKSHITLFMQKKGIVNFNESDIVCFKNESMLEIIINNYYVSNSTQRDIVVKELLQYIFQIDKNTSIVSKLGINTFSDFPGADMIQIPSTKHLINTDFVEYIDTLVGNIEKCTKLDKNGNTYITVNVIGVQNNAEKIKHITNHLASKEDEISIVDEFVNYIVENKPKWYKEGKWIRKDLIYNKCVLQCGTLSKKAFAMKFKNVLFCEEDRKMVNKERCYVVKLFKYSEIDV